MPELPEVETVRKTLEKNYVNKKISFVEILLPRMILSPIEEFKTNLTNTKFKSFRRKGKFLIIDLDNSFSFISHLRMEGKYILRNENEPNSAHTRVIFHLENEKKLCYDDSRSFGIMKMCKTDEIFKLPELQKVGPEPFEINDSKYLFDKYHKIKTEIKISLLDQSIMCGLGNIYADEVLFKCKLNPYLPSNQVSEEDCDNILKYSKETLIKAIKLGGSTISSYHPEKGVDGKFQNELIAYGRNKEHCIFCNHIMRKDKLNGRGTTYCPNCQHVAISVGITGKIASGKSTVLKYLQNKNYKVFSCDDEVKKLYSTLEVKKHLIEMFSEQVINDNGTISYSYIKNTIASNELLKKKLENYIHPLIKENIRKFIHKNKQEEFVFIEVPLMFETKFNLLFDYVVGISCSSITQINHLKARKAKNVNLDLLLNKSTTFDKNAHKCNFLIYNDKSIDDLYNQIDSILQNMRQE